MRSDWYCSGSYPPSTSVRFKSFRSRLSRSYSYTELGVTSDVYVNRNSRESNSGFAYEKTSKTGSGISTRCSWPELNSTTRNCDKPAARSETTAWFLNRLKPDTITSGRYGMKSFQFAGSGLSTGQVTTLKLVASPRLVRM